MLNVHELLDTFVKSHDAKSSTPLRDLAGVLGLTVRAMWGASGPSIWNWETWVDIQTLSPNMSVTWAITSQSLHFQTGKVETIKLALPPPINARMN